MVKTHSKSTSLHFWALGSLPSVHTTSAFTVGPHRVPALQQLLESESVSPPLLFLCFKILRKYLGFLEIPYIGPIYFFFKFLQDTPWTLWALGCAEPWIALSGRLWLWTQPLPCFRLYSSSPGSVSVLPSFPIFSATPEVLCSQ